MRYWAAILLLAIGWGSSFFFNEILLRELGPLMVGLGRVGFGALGCWIWVFGTKAVRGGAVGLGGASVVALVLFSALQYAIPLTIYPLTQQYITSSAAGIVNAMTPIMVVVVSHLWPQGERMTLLRSIGVLFGFLGILLLALPSLQGQGESDPIALLATIAAPLCYAFAMNLIRWLDAMDRVLLTTWSLTFATFVLAPIAVSVEGVPVIAQMSTWYALFTIGFLLTSAAFILLFWLVPRVGGTTASTVTFIAPVSSVLLGVFILKEQLLPIHMLGMGVIFIGMIFVDGRLLKRLNGKARQ